MSDNSNRVHEISKTSFRPERSDDLPEFHVSGSISPITLQQLREWIRTIKRSIEAPLYAHPFMVVTPLGLPAQEKIARWLNTFGYAIQRRTPIPDWAAASTVLYPRTDDDERLTVALGFNSLWRTVCQDLRAERWELATPGDIRRLSEEKSKLREQCGSQRFRVIMPTVTFHARLQALHVPDPDRYVLEHAILDAVCSEAETPDVLRLPDLKSA